MTASPNKIDIILRKTLADTARAQEQLALEVVKRTDAHANLQAVSGLLQDGMDNTMSALKHWELEKKSGVQFGSYTPLPLSAQSSKIFIQDESRYVYQQQQQSGAAQFSDVCFRRRHQMVIHGASLCQFHAWIVTMPAFPPCLKCNYLHLCFNSDGSHCQCKRLQNANTFALGCFTNCTIYQPKSLALQ